VKSKIENFKCLIFDFDDTLVHSSKSYVVALETIGIYPGDLEYQAARQETKIIIGDGHVSARNRLLYFKRMLEAKKEFSADKVLNLMSKYEAALEAEVKRHWSDCNREILLKKLSENSTLSIISNENTRTQLLKLRAVDPRGALFKHAIFSEDVGVEKPDPKIFKYFLDSTGFSVTDCCMIGDSYENDIEPCVKLGMNAVLTSEFVKSPSHHPWSVDNLEDLFKA